jgi:hypothetical protein
MKRPSLVYYISGHGFGHARRSAAVIRSVLALVPDAMVHIRTHAPAHLFDDLGENVRHCPIRLDPGCIEKDLFTIDTERTVAAARAALANRAAVVESEVSFVQEHRAQLVLADIPVLAGDIASAAGVRCVGISNFTWDFIYKPFAPAELVEKVRGSYAMVHTLLRMPIGGCCDRIVRVIDIPHIGSRPRHSREEVLGRLGLLSDPRPRVLMGLRGGISAQTVHAAARGSPDVLFLVAGDRGADAPENLRGFSTGKDLEFIDVTSACDIVLSKLGYGINADCLATGTALLWPRRTGFAEDAISERVLPEYLRMREMPLVDLYSGNWREHIQALLSMPRPAATCRTDGDREAARLISEMLG